jgi:hypothetical protein
MKKIIIVCLFILPFSIHAEDTLTNVELISFDDVTIRTSDMQPVPIVQIPVAYALADNETEINITLALDNPAPRDFDVYYVIDYFRSYGDINMVSIPAGEEDFLITVEVDQDKIRNYTDVDELFEIDFKGDSQINNYQSEDLIEVLFNNGQKSKTEVYGSIIVVTDSNVQHLVLQVQKLQEILQALIQIQALINESNVVTK